MSPTFTSRFLPSALLIPLLGSTAIVSACGDSSNPPVDDSDAMGGAAPADTDEPQGELTDIPCEFDRDCSDGAFCNGEETCDDGFCRTGVAPRCEDGIECTIDSCNHAENRCQFLAPDEDGDGHADAACLGPDGEALGDDCDDSDSNRYPGNIERCTADEPEHDEDCDPGTFGFLDSDLDGEISSACCNEDADGELNCGTDCNDDDYRMNSTYPEICDELDNDCDGRVDVDTREVDWFPDADGDHFGDGTGEAITSCAPVEGHSLKPTDCDDGAAAVHGAAREECDGFDNDCDGEIDEDGVCACAPDGNARPCACDADTTGTQVCAGGLWGSCDCTECVDGAEECIGELLPRHCKDGRWEIQTACSGLRPLCLEGSCVCADGTDDCVDIDDVFPPTLVTTSPLPGSSDLEAGSIIALEFSEDIDVASAQGALTLTDAEGKQLSGTIGVGGSVVSFVPDEDLLPGRYFKLSISTKITDLSGHALLSEEKIDFQTSSGLQQAGVSADSEIIYINPQFAMSPSGKNLLTVQKAAAFMAPSQAPHLSTFSWTGSTWSHREDLLTNHSLAQVGVSDSEDAIVTASVGDPLLRYFMAPGETTTGDSLSSYKSQNPSVLEMNGAGEAFVAFARDATGGTPITYQFATSADWGAETTMAGTAGDTAAIRSDISETGYGIMVFKRSSKMHELRSLANLTTWNEGANAGGPPDAVKDFNVAMSEAGVATVVWQDQYKGSDEKFYGQLVAQDLSLLNLWVDSPAQIDTAVQFRTERNPSVDVDGSGNVFVAYHSQAQSQNPEVHVVRRDGGVWSTSQALNAIQTTQITDISVKVTPTGEAVVIWRQNDPGQTRYDVWGARYENGTWGEAQMIENFLDTVLEVTWDLDDSGRAVVVMEIRESVGDPNTQDNTYSVEF